MNRKEYENKFNELIDLHENNHDVNLEIKIIRLENVITFGREFNSKYKVPHKRIFMNETIKYTDELLDILEQLLCWSKLQLENKIYNGEISR